MKFKTCDSKNRIANVVIFLLCCAFVFSFENIGMSVYQVKKDAFFYLGICSVILITLVIRKAHLFDIKKIAVSVLAFAYILYYQYIHRADWGYQYRDMLIVKHISFLLLGISVWDMIERDSYEERQIIRSKVLAGVFCVAFGVALILGQEYVAVILIPVFVWYQMPVDKDSWRRLINTLSAAFYCTFVVMMTWSLIVSPDGYTSGRYEGIFIFPGVGGILASLAIFSTIYLWLQYRYIVNKKWLRNLILILLLAFPVFSFFLFFNRAAVISMIITGVFMWVISAKTDRKKKALRRGIIVIIMAIVLFVAEIVAIKTLQKADLSGVQEYVRENGEKPGMYVLNRIIGTVTSKESRTGLFEGGTVINAFDTMFSTRISIWYLGIKNIRLLGNAELGVTLPDGEFVAHTHNTYLDWFLRLGIIGGTLMVIWFIVYLAVAIRRHLECDAEVLFPLIWAIFCIGYCLVERELWNDFPTFLLVLFQYPLLFKLSGERKQNE